MGAYLLVAIGLINLRYQSGHNSVLAHSLSIVIPGGLLLAATWIPAAVKLLNLSACKAVTVVLGVILIAYAVIN